MHRILLVGLGPLGRMVALDAARRGIARVVAAVDPDPAIAGKAVSHVAPESGFASPIAPSLDKITDWSGIDAAVVCTSSDLARCAPTLRALIARGLPIVSTCEELLFPWLRHRALADELHALAVSHNSRLLGTGVNPGFLMDTLPVFASAVCRSVRGVHVWRIQDATTRRIPFQQKIGAGLDDAAFAEKVRSGALRHVGLGESVHFVARYLGLEIDRWDESIEPVKADRDLNCAIGPIARGRAAGVRQVARAWARGATPGAPPLIQMEFQAAIGQPDPHDRVQLDAEPPIDLVLKGGVHGDIATVAITLNCIAPLMASQAGLHTMATIPVAACRMADVECRM
ncbi:MAG: dihydrodipicolinate reductase [Phycisphaerales bacterium]|nr:dihydrodipicolinate reductase [Phycisphaerales bacterium]